VILLSGMVFVSKGFPLGSPGYKAMTAFVAMVVLISITGFIAFVGFEVGDFFAGIVDSEAEYHRIVAATSHMGQGRVYACLDSLSVVV
jgi:hypothetical protein